MSTSLIVCDAQQTRELLDIRDVMQAVADVSKEYETGQILSPERMVVPLAGEGVMLSMPAVSADIAIHKLVNIQPGNSGSGLPTIHGQVSVYDAISGKPLCVLDGPEVTGIRTAAVSMLAVQHLYQGEPNEFLIVGTGGQAEHHLRALAALYPKATVWVKGRNAARTAAFCETQAGVDLNLQPCPAEGVPASVQVVILVTTSNTPVYDEAPVAGRLVVGAGSFKPDMAEIAASVVNASAIYVDDRAGTRAEAGDLIQANVDWDRVGSLASMQDAAPDFSRPIVFKSVGTGAWDLAAARAARIKLGL